MRRTTRIANRDVPIQAGDPTTVAFSTGRLGESEAGPWEFWTVVSDQGLPITVRCRPGLDPGERFRQVEQREADKPYWPIVAAATSMRPATQDEVKGWLEDKAHTEDIAQTCQVGGKTMRIVKADNGFRFE